MNVFATLHGERRHPGCLQRIYRELDTSRRAHCIASRILDQSTDGVDAIIAGNDALATGVMATLKERGLDGKIMIAGQDAQLSNLKAIMKGTQTCTILKPLKEMARITAELAVSLAIEKPLKMKFTTESKWESIG